jgi:hypothetical protein
LLTISDIDDRPQINSIGRTTPTSIDGLQPGNGDFGTAVTSNRSGRTTPVNVETPVTIDKVLKKKNGQEKEAYAYTGEEHGILLLVMGNVENAFNSFKSSDDWKQVYHGMLKSHYAVLGKVPHASKTLHDFIQCS